MQCYHVSSSIHVRLFVEMSLLLHLVAATINTDMGFLFFGSKADGCEFRGSQPALAQGVELVEMHSQCSEIFCGTCCVMDGCGCHQCALYFRRVLGLSPALRMSITHISRILQSSRGCSRRCQGYIQCERKPCSELLSSGSIDCQMVYLLSSDSSNERMTQSAAPCSAVRLCTVIQA